MNAVEIEEAVSELALQPFEATEFPFSFLEAFGNKSTTIKKLRSGSSNKSDVDGAILQRNNIHILVSEEGKVTESLELLRISASTKKNKVEFILATDGIDFQAENVFSGETVACEYEDFHNYFGFFLSLANITTVKQIRESAFDIKATSRLNKLYIELLRANPEWALSDRRHDMNHFLARLIFCFFAEDTNIFKGDNLFTGTVQKMSDSDASNTHEIIGEIFRAMDTRVTERKEKKVRNWVTDFPYVNGELFSGSTECPKFTKIARSYLLHVGNLDWKQINPDIFGSMIQAVADEEERGFLGMHYTSVPNILKVLNPLFLDDLNEQLEDAGENSRKLLNLRKRLSRIRVFDPACGSGNFLVIAYKQMREIEHKINIRRGEGKRASEIPLTNFRGIELRDFSAEIARLALIIAEFQCDVLYLGQQLALAEFLPLDAKNWITKGNALEINWLSVCPPTGTGVKLQGDDLFSTPLDQAEIDFDNEGGETYICGNPPYLGSREQKKHHKADLENVFKGVSKKWKALDYISGWFLKAANYSKVSKANTAFVTTNSICQGQQVPLLWPIIFKTGSIINFAHTSFKWANLASHNAGVTVVIVGLSRDKIIEKRLFSVSQEGDTIEKRTSNINAYLAAAKNVELIPSKRAISGQFEMVKGNYPVDGGNLLLSVEEFRKLKLTHSQKERFIRPFIGSSEIIKGHTRYCVWIDNDDKAQEAFLIPELEKRFEAVKTMRLSSKKEATKRAAKTPYKFDEIRQSGKENYAIAIPVHSSENRNYLPVVLLPNPVIVYGSAFALYDAPIWHLSIIASSLHLIWIKTVCGQLETRLRYSNTLGWNTFPIPALTQKNKDDLTACSEEILIARERHFPATIADLYDPNKMPEDLRLAHERNDEVLERIYIGRKFKNDTERLEKLFQLYTKMTSNK